jgi:hypothetical protein
VGLRSRLLLMLQDIDQLSEWITNVESAHSPRLGRRAVFDSDTRFLNSHQSLFNIVYFNQKALALSTSDVATFETMRLTFTDAPWRW